MPSNSSITIAAKCALQKEILDDIKKSGLEAVELYLSADSLEDIEDVIRICKNYGFRYAVHAPGDVYKPHNLAKLTEALKAEVVVFHNTYWEDEWGTIADVFKDIKTKPCIENTFSAHEPIKFMRRYGFGRCLDLEHLQMECAGVYEEVFIDIIKEASHIHMSGYGYGTQLWHSHIHHSPKHSRYLLSLLKRADYNGLVVSEARRNFQNFDEFRKLKLFFDDWKTT